MLKWGLHEYNQNWPLFFSLVFTWFCSESVDKGKGGGREVIFILHGALSLPMTPLLPILKPTPRRKHTQEPKTHTGPTKQPWAFHMHSGDSLSPTHCAVIWIAHDLMLIETHPSLWRVKWTWEEQSDPVPFSCSCLWEGRSVCRVTVVQVRR